MPRTHIVAEGEHMAGIAAKYGFGSYRTVWDHPDNAALKATRSPHVLAPGDVVVIPDFEPRMAEGATERRHRFFRKRTAIELRIVFQRADGAPLAGAPFDIDLPGAPATGAAAADGMLSVSISEAASMGVLATGGARLAARVGALDPIDAVAGWQGRLANLGYYTGEIGQEDDPRSRLALEEFQLDSSLPLTGALDPATASALLAAHGS